MSIKKWIMKQYWRVDTVRASASLVLGMFVLGRMYYSSIPSLAVYGIYGAIILGVFFIFFFLIVGWLYDERLKVWNEAMQAAVERHVYYFVPSPRSFAIEYPFFYATTTTLRDLVRLSATRSSSMDAFLKYADWFYQLHPSKRNDIFGALPHANEYMFKHSFQHQQLETQYRRPWGSRIKKSFQIQLMRVGWIQSLTGLAQDVLILGAFYLVVLFPEVARGDSVPVEYLFLGIVFISFPLFLILLALGWYYDRQLQLWSPTLAVEAERDPYNYVPSPKVRIIILPFVYTFLRVMNDITTKKSLDNSSLASFAKYLNEYTTLEVTQDANIQRAITMRKSLGTLFQRGVE